MGLPPFQRLLDDHGAAVHRFLVLSVGTGDADDCYQETVLAALRAYRDLRDAENLCGWLFRIAQRKAVDSHRQRARRPQLGADGELERVATPPTDDPAEVVVRAELWTALRRLPSRQRVAMGHRFGADLAYREIATVMECTEEAARRSVHEALRRLRQEVTR